MNSGSGEPPDRGPLAASPETSPRLFLDRGFGPDGVRSVFILGEPRLVSL